MITVKSPTYILRREAYNMQKKHPKKLPLKPHHAGVSKKYVLESFEIFSFTFNDFYIKNII